MLEPKNPYKGRFCAHELLAIIDDTIFDKKSDKVIAINHYVNAISVDECADLVGYNSGKSVQARLGGIKECIDFTILKTLKQ
jgi:hypothetical protein